MPNDKGSKPTLKTFNLKLQKEVKNRLKQVTHDRGVTMQAVLSAFADSYADHPDRFKLKMEVADGKLERDGATA